MGGLCLCFWLSFTWHVLRTKAGIPHSKGTATCFVGVVPVLQRVSASHSGCGCAGWTLNDQMGIVWYFKECLLATWIGGAGWIMTVRLGRRCVGSSKDYNWAGACSVCNILQGQGAHAWSLEDWVHTPSNPVFGKWLFRRGCRQVEELSELVLFEIILPDKCTQPYKLSGRSCYFTDVPKEISLSPQLTSRRTPLNIAPSYALQRCSRDSPIIRCTEE